MARSPAGSRVAIMLVLGGLMACSAIIVQMNPTHDGFVNVHLDFQDDSGKSIIPIWRAMNIWDITHFNTTHLPDMAVFKARHPTVDTIVFMTATGGRSSGTNDFVRRETNGTLAYDFSTLTTSLDRAVDAGFDVELVIGNVPRALANKTAFEASDYGAFDALTLPPGNWTEYGWYIDNLTAACVDRYGLGNVSGWEFRLMTEPDYRDWWTAGVNAYVGLWIATFEPLKARVPGARLVLGNMAWHDDLTFTDTVLRAVKAVNMTLLPDTVSFSYYHSLRHLEPRDDLTRLVSRWETLIYGLDLGKDVAVSCEEGFILVDENGDRLWLGDGTELGAAWEAWMLSSVMNSTFTRFVQWPMEVDGYISTRGLVHQLGTRITGSGLVMADLVFGPSDPAFTRTVGAFGGKNASGGSYHVLLHQYIPDRDWAHRKDVTLAIEGLPAGSYNVTMFWINKTRNNWFTGWMVDVTEAGLEINNDCSLYDLSVGAPFGHATGWSFWWNWRQAHPPVNHVVPEPSSVMVATQGTPVTMNLELLGNCVVLVELQLI